MKTIVLLIGVAMLWLGMFPIPGGCLPLTTESATQLVGMIIFAMAMLSMAKEKK